MDRSAFLAGFMALLFHWSGACAQEIRAFLARETVAFEAVGFGAGAGTLDPSSSIGNAVFVPPGKGPFPAVVLAHSCGGVNRPHIRERMLELLDAGFAVLAVDSFNPRGFAASCSGNPRRVTASVTTKDAYAALMHLASLPQVDASRIYATGYSWGALVTVMLASPQSAEAFGSALRFRATVSNYGACSVQRGPGAPRAQFLQRDIDRPLLMLMASEDKEYKPADCFPLLDELMASGRPVDWHVYPDTHHAWDHRDHNGKVKVTTGWGEVSTYLYSAEATRDSTRRMIEFFRRHK